MGTQASVSGAKPQNHQIAPFKRSSASFHSLHSPREHHNHKQYILKKWNFASFDKANKKYNELKIKQNNKSDYITSVQQVQLGTVHKGNHEVKAKLQFSQVTLKCQIQRRSKCYHSYGLSQLWDMVERIIQIAIYFTQHLMLLPNEMSSYLIINSKIKVKDFSLLPGLKLGRSDPFNYNVSKILCRIIANLGLLQNDLLDVNLIEINRINIKYCPAIATFLYTIMSKQMAPKQILQFSHKMRQTNMIQFNPVLSQTQKKPSFKKIKFKKQNQLSNYIAITDKKRDQIQNKQSVQIKINTNLKVAKDKHYKRVQQIKPKSLEKSKFITPLITPRITQQQNKQNKHCNQQLDKSNISSNIDINDHNFPQKVKQFRKTSVTLSDISGSRNNEMKTSQARNQAFMKMTGGEKCQLFNQNNEQSLLESIIESQQSVIVRGSESPVLNLDQQIESITSDFMKLQQPFIQNQHQHKSISEFECQRNFTIIEVTQEHQQSEENSKSIKIGKSQISSSIEQNISKFEDSCSSYQQQKFVIEQYEGGSKYQGYTTKGLRNGFGKLYYEDGGSYEGHWKEGQINGFGKLYYQSGELAYQGNWLNGQFHGEGKIINECPQRIIGKYNYEDLSDIGTAWLWYEGNFEKDNKHGAGSLLLSNGQKFSGIWQKNNVQGEGIFSTIDGIKIRGKWINNILVETMGKQYDNQIL